MRNTTRSIVLISSLMLTLMSCQQATQETRVSADTLNISSRQWSSLQAYNDPTTGATKYYKQYLVFDSPTQGHALDEQNSPNSFPFTYRRNGANFVITFAATGDSDGLIAWKDDSWCITLTSQKGGQTYLQTFWRE